MMNWRLKKIPTRRLPPQVLQQLMPGFLWMFFFLIIPLCIVLVFSFMQKGSYGRINYNFNLLNYARVFEPIYLKILFKSFLLSSYTTALCFLISWPVAYLMARSSSRVKSVFMGLVIIPFWTNFVVRIYALKLVMGETGLINQVLLELNLLSEPLQMVNNTFGVAVGMVYNYLPFMILPLYVNLEKLDFTLLDAAYDLGANKLQTLAKVLLPLSIPGIITGCLFVFIPAFGEFVIPDMMGGARSMYIGSLISETFLKTRDWPFGSALSSILVLMAMVSFMVVISRTHQRKSMEKNIEKGFAKA